MYEQSPFRPGERKRPSSISDVSVGAENLTAEQEGSQRMSSEPWFKKWLEDLQSKKRSVQSVGNNNCSSF
jgi:hypothetical protein